MHRISKIKPIHHELCQQSKKIWDSIAKPLGSFGLLEHMIQQIAGIQNTVDIRLNRRKVIVMCADHGVVREGVTQTDSSVTAVCAQSIADGKSNINMLADVYHAQVIPVDIGMNTTIQHKNLINKKIMYGTNNITESSAMTVTQAEQAICVGMDIVRDLKPETDILITGEMGIGNTTPASALASVLLDKSVKEVTGRGAGLSETGLQRKITVIQKAIHVNQPDKSNPIELLAKLGGLDIAGMTGLFLGSAYYQLPIIIDGMISAVAAVIACQINPLCKDYLLASHVSDEPSGKYLLDKIGLTPVIHAGLRLGEGTGGILLLPLLDGALNLYRNAHRFEDIHIERYVNLT